MELCKALKMWDALRASGSVLGVTEEAGLAEDVDGNEKQKKRTQSVLTTI